MPIIVSRSHAKPKKSLGQNFLIDENIARNIIRDMHLSQDDVVVEVGPGRGALTKYLLPEVHHLVAVEIDGRLVTDLRSRFRSASVSVLHEDFLDLDLSGVQRQFGRRLRLVGNIPYCLTSEILIKAFDHHTALKDFTMMVQREVAQRLAAPHGTKQYGILSVYARFYGTMEVLFRVSPNCFYPRPKVASAVIQEQLHEDIPYDVDEQLFRTTVRTAFGKRRKTLRNALKYLPLETRIVDAVTKGRSTILDKRPEQLTVEQFVDFTNRITETIHAASLAES